MASTMPRDPAQLETWFGGAPDLNLGIATGPVLGLLVVDVDPRNDGEASYRRLEEQLGSFDHAPRVITPSGGRHLYFRFSDSGRLRSKLGQYPGIDFQGAGKYVLAPPSQVGGNPYGWVDSSIVDVPPPEAPAELVALLREAGSPAGREVAFDGTGRIAEGGRNDKLTKIAGSLRRQGLEATEIAATLLTINAERCFPPLDEAEVLGIARSIGCYPAGPPRECTDLGNARRLVERFGEDIRYCRPWKFWLVWDGTRWVKDDTGAVERMAKEMAEAIVHEAEMVKKGTNNGE